jgi:hypothetical protein
MLQIFERDWNTKVYGEFSILSSNEGLRLNPLDSVKRVLKQDRVPLIVLKPLVESQNTLNLLDYFEGSKALWLFRHYRDVASSYVKKWGDRHSINDLRAIVEKRPQDWRYENVSGAVEQIVLDHFSEDMGAYDASALYWFVRNTLFFELNLDKSPRVMICKYEDLVAKSARVMRNVYEFLGHRFPGDKIVSMVHSASVNKGENTRLSPQIDLLCRELLDRLDQTWGDAQAEFSIERS